MYHLMQTTIVLVLYQEPGRDMFVRHFHFLRWPDFGVPAADAMLSFVRKVNEHVTEDGAPTIVHCRLLSYFVSI